MKLTQRHSFRGYPLSVWTTGETAWFGCRRDSHWQVYSLVRTAYLCVDITGLCDRRRHIQVIGPVTSCRNWLYWRGWKPVETCGNLWKPVEICGNLETLTPHIFYLSVIDFCEIELCDFNSAFYPCGLMEEVFVIISFLMCWYLDNLRKCFSVSDIQRILIWGYDWLYSEFRINVFSGELEYCVKWFDIVKLEKKGVKVHRWNLCWIDTKWDVDPV